MTDPLRVLVVQGGAERAGGERVMLGLVRRLPAHGVEPTVAFAADGPFVDEVRAAGVPVVRLAASARLRQPHRLPAVVRGIADAARGFDVLHANGEKMAVLTAWAARRAGLPAVSWLHDEPLRGPGPFAVHVALRLAPRTTWVACSSWMAQAFERRLRVPVQAIRNGLDLASRPAEAVDPRSVAGWPSDAEVATFVGRLQRWKGVDVFLEAAAAVAPHHPTARFLVVGAALFGWERRYAERLPALAADLGVADRVHFTGHRPDAVALMGGSDVVVHASRRPEPFGMVVVEAMAEGRAVVATRTRGPEEIIDAGRTGLLVPPGDPHALAAAVRRLLEDPEARAELGRQAREAAHRDFSADAMAARFADLHRQLAGTSSAQGRR